MRVFVALCALSAFLAWDVQAEPVSVRATFLESPEPDVASCQANVRAVDNGTVLATSNPFPALKDGQPRTVTFSAEVAGVVPDALFDITIFCSDEAGLTSIESAPGTILIPKPNLPPNPPTLVNCEFTVSVTGTPQPVVVQCEVKPAAAQ